MDTPLKTVICAATLWTDQRVDAIRRLHETLWAQVELALREGWVLPDETRSIKLVLFASPDAPDVLRPLPSPPSDAP